MSSRQDDRRRPMMSQSELARTNASKRYDQLADTRYDQDDYDDRPTKRARDDDGDGQGKGMQMLMKLGWKGQGLGKEEQGRTAPVEASSNESQAGVGKDRFDSEIVARATGGRMMESARIALETDEQRQERLERVQQRERQKADVKEALEKFHCQVCNKGYAKVGQYEEHLKSYDHHHQARQFAAKQEAKEALVSSGALDQRREKERKREEKELRKLMGAAGVKVDAAAPAPALGTLPAKPETNKAAPVKIGGFKPVGFKTGGFKPISLSSAPPSKPPRPSSWSNQEPAADDDDEGSLVPKKRDADLPVPASKSSVTGGPKALSGFKSGGIINQEQSAAPSVATERRDQGDDGYRPPSRFDRAPDHHHRQEHNRRDDRYQPYRR